MTDITAGTALSNKFHVLYLVGHLMHILHVMPQWSFEYRAVSLYVYHRGIVKSLIRTPRDNTKAYDLNP